MRRHPQRLERQQTGSPDRSPQVIALGERGAQVIINRQIEPRFMRHQPGLGLNRELELVSAPHAYDRPGRYTVAVKVIDLFGNDTMTLVPVNVG